MRRSSVFVVALVMMGATLTAPTAVGAGGRALRPSAGTHLRPSPRVYRFPDLSKLHAPFVPGKVLVEFRRGVGRSEARAVDTAVPGARVLAHVGMFGVDVVGLPARVSVRSAIRRYLADPRVRYAEPDLPRPPADTIPNDPLFPQQWALQNTGQDHPIADPPPSTAKGLAGADIHATTAWDTQKGNVIVAVLDSGVDITHPDLAGNIWVNPGEIPGNGIDDDGNGYVDDVNGWDFASNDNSPTPGTETGHEHGTHVAGIIAAVQNNAVGVSGVCPACKIMPLRFAFDTATEVSAIAYAVANGASILNASFGGPVWSNIERDAIEQAGAAGLLVVAAAGNNAHDNDMATVDAKDNLLSPEYPASYDLPTILSVAATNHNDEYGYGTGCAMVNPKYTCLFTNWGHDSVDVGAPGVDVLSTFPVADGSYGTADGTSQAAAEVAGVAALVKSQNPTYTPVDVKNAIMNSVVKPASLTQLSVFKGAASSGMFTRTSGRIDASAALVASTANATPLTDGNIDGAIPLGESKLGSVAWPNDDNDVYKKQLSQGHRFKVALKGTSGANFDLVVWKPGTREIWEVTAACLGAGGTCPIAGISAGKTADEQVTFKATTAGTYYFQVSSFFSAGAYTLTITKIS